MSLLKAIKRLEYANFLIRKKATGDLETFARKMKLSKSAVKEILHEMRALGANIKYNKVRKSYYYEEDGEFCISKFMKYGDVVPKDEVAKIGRPEDLCFSEKATFVLCEEN
ncbi:MAG: hypothetical protein ACTHLE_26880 [Agriterribacter sp.]